MKPLSILFTKSKKKCAIGSWLIRMWTGQPYSHVVRHTTVMGDIPLYYQASEGKVNYECAEVFNSKHLVVKEYILDVPPHCVAGISRSCLENVGKVYAMKQNIGVGIGDIIRFFGGTFRNPWKSGQNCSELIYTIVLKTIIPELDLDADAVKPHHIEEIIHKYFEKTDHNVWKLKAH